MPCTNCLRFHFGECREAVKQCFKCKGFNHIERYCPSQKYQIKSVPGEPLAGTRPWCEMHGLHHDPELKQRVLNALKTNPGSAIYINGACIYLGTEKHFDVRDMAWRGSSLKDRIKRDRERSMSPPRYRQPSPQGYRGRSPPRYSPPREQRYRSRSPFRQRQRTPSPYRWPSYAQGRQPDYRPRTPRYAQDRTPPQRAASVAFNMPPDLFNTSHGAPQASRNGTVHGQSINRGSQLQARDANSQPMQGVKELQSQTRKSSYFNDPHFVLGITRGAGRDEIIDAYQQRMREVEEERRVDACFRDRMPAHVWEDSIGILNAAKRQLIGGR